MKFRALWHNQRHTWIEDLDYPRKDEVVVQSLVSFISQGSERRVISKPMNETLALKMRIPHMLGSFRSNFTYGYSLVGRVELGPPELTDRFVHLLHPHQDRAFVDDKDITILPGGVSPRIGVLTSNGETALNALWDSGIHEQNKILVVGFGVIGMLIALFARTEFNAKVIVREIDKSRRLLAQELGFAIHQNIDPIDLAFHSSGSEQGLQYAIDAVGFEGKIIELSWYGAPVRVDLGSSFHYDRKQIICSQVSHVAKPFRKHTDFHTRRSKVFELLSSLSSELGILVDDRIPFDQSPAFFDQLRQGEVKSISTIIDYQNV